MVASLPGLGRSQVADMRDVMAAVPAIDQRGQLDALRAVLGMAEAALPLDVVERLEEHDPAGVEAFDKLERPLDGGGGVVQGGPGLLVVGFDDGPILGEGEADADKG